MYVPSALDLDGSADYFSYTGLLASAPADGKVALFSCWLNPDDRSVNHVFLDSNANGFLVWNGTNGKVSIWLEQANQARVVYLLSSILTVVGGWNHIAFTVDTASGYSIYINGVADGAITENDFVADGLIDYTRAAWTVGAKVAAVNHVKGRLCEVYMTNEYLDLSVAANLQKFRTVAGKPEDLGSDGSTPTGTSPLIYMKFAEGAHGTNSGTGGNFTENGAPVRAIGPVTPRQARARH